MITPDCFLCFMLGFISCILLWLLTISFFFKYMLPRAKHLISREFKDAAAKLFTDDETKPPDAN